MFCILAVTEKKVKKTLAANSFLAVMYAAFIKNVMNQGRLPENFKVVSRANAPENISGELYLKTLLISI